MKEHSYIITSREGLYHFSTLDGRFTLLREGKYFGICSNNSIWYVFKYTGDKNIPSDTGVIESFYFNKETLEISNLKVVAETLDNGSHQMIIYNNKLYLLETYHQRIRVFDINDDGTLTTRCLHYPLETSNIKNARYVCSGMLDGDVTCTDYLHMNAISIQDNLVYISCPHLRNMVDNNQQPSHHKLPHTIMVFTLDFNYLWTHELENIYYCHDCVFVGHHIYLTCPPMTIIRYCIVEKHTEKIHTMHSNKHYDLPRGLSIHPNGDMLYGFRVPGRICTTTKCWKTPNMMKPCCIVNLDIDMNDNNTLLRKAHVIQTSVTNIGYLINSTNLTTLKNMIMSEKEWETCNIKQHKDPIKQYSTTTYAFDQIIRPPSDIFENVVMYQVSHNNKIPMQYIEGMEQSQIWQYFIRTFRNPLEANGFNVTGKLYLYPPGHNLGWHTNIESCINNHSYRCYIVMTSEDNQSFFMYKHPVSGLLHAVPDRDMHVSVFNLGTRRSPLWHAVINNSSSCYRLSIGFASDKRKLEALFNDTRLNIMLSEIYR